MSILILLTVVCIITYSFEIVFGLAGTVMMLPIMSFWIDTKTLVIYSVLPQIIVAAMGLIFSPKTVKKNFLTGMVAVASVGIFIGLTLFYFFPNDLFRILLAIAVIVFGLYLVIAPHLLKVTPYTARGMDFMAGVSQGLFGISGPIAVTRLLATFDDHTVVRNYALAFFLVMNIFRAGGYAVNGTYTPEILQMMLFSAPFLLGAMWYANRWHFRVNKAVFRRVVAWLILLGGLSLLIR